MEQVSNPPVSLFDQLTHQPSAGFPLTKLSTQLLEIMALDACLVARNRNCIYWIVFSMREVRNDVDLLLATLDDGGFTMEKFDHCTETILYLEESLQSLGSLVAKEVGRSKISASDTIQGNLEFIEEWQQTCQILRRRTRELMNSPHFSGDLSSNERQFSQLCHQDDIAIFKALSQHLTVNGSVTSTAAPRQVESIFARLAGIENAISLGNRAESSFRLVEAMEKHVNGIHPQTTEEVVAAYETFVNQLTNQLPPPPVPSLTKLRPLIAKIGRCTSLAGSFSKNKTAVRLSRLNVTIKTVVDALTLIAEISYDPTVVFIEQTHVMQAISVAEQSDSAEPFSHQLNQARTADVDSLSRVHTMLNDRTRINVTFQDSKGVIHEWQFLVNPTASLRTVLWLARLSLPENHQDLEVIHIRGAFHVDAQELDLETEISEVKSSDLTLYLGH
ncbi:hypothetical protein R3P38DRAFT_3354720 [Favolaschia claudopus]|uniref:Uncharacterized protein n=1 Tax=Favolaschia claudopus TaxID=2862362 RepID=A0AAW0BNA5_9AGAR